jgi:multidrug resistance efflux pump
MTRKVAFSILSICALFVAISLAGHHYGAATQVRPKLTSISSADAFFAAPSRVEAGSEMIEVGADTSGTVHEIYVSEGQNVRRGQILAVISCEDLRADLSQAFADIEAAKQEQIRILRGDREEQRHAATQNTISKKASEEEASLNLERTQALFKEGIVPRSSLDEAQRNSNVSWAAYQAALAQEQLSHAGPLPEEANRAAALLLSAERKAIAIHVRLDRCSVKAPSDGQITRILLHQGESFSALLPKPLFLLANTDHQRLRAEVDEYDVNKVFRKQRVTFWQDSDPSKIYVGYVDRLIPIMGRKTIYSGDPTEKSDRDILEVLVAPTDTEQAGKLNRLPIGLRMTARFEGTDRGHQ